MSRDEKYRRDAGMIQDFDFGLDTVRVFDDMIDRSVPFYQEIQRMIGEIASEFAAPFSSVYDLGCSTGNTLQALDASIGEDVLLVGLDASEEMLVKARQKFMEAPLRHELSLQKINLEGDFSIENASVVVLNLTLQFIRPMFREALIQKIARGTRPQGCLILIEKVLSEDSSLNRLFIRNHYALKRRNGYSEMEISRKREALENILIPYHEAENKALLARNGFRRMETFFRWYNFSGLIALRDEQT